jgi:hypothetical protein
MLPRQIILPSPLNSANSFVPMLLQPLELSCLSFCSILPLFSMVYGLFLQNTGGGGTSACSATLQSSCLRTFNRFITPFPATHPSRAKLRGEDSPVSPFFATHTEAPTASPLLATHPKNGGPPANRTTSYIPVILMTTQVRAPRLKTLRALDGAAAAHGDLAA